MSGNSSQSLKDDVPLGKVNVYVTSLLVSSAIMNGPVLLLYFLGAGCSVNSA